MVAWDVDDQWSGDFDLAQNGFVTRVRHADSLAWWLRRVEPLGYDVRRLDASGWSDVERLHQDLARELSFPDYYGRNLDALDDCLSDVAEGAYGWDTSARGLLLVLHDYERFLGLERRVANAVLDILEWNGRRAMLFGFRVLTIAQVGADKADLLLDEVGGHPVWQLDRDDPSPNHDDG